MTEDPYRYSLVKTMVPVVQTSFGCASEADVHVLFVACGSLITVDTKAAVLQNMSFATHKCHIRNGVRGSTEA